MLEQAISDIAEVLQRRLDALIAIGRINAILSTGDATLILPSPAVALAKLSSRQTLTLSPTMILRSRDHTIMGEDVIFSPIVHGGNVHPWEVSGCRWLSVDGNAANSNNPRTAVTGIAIELTREADSTAREGWLSLFIDAGESCILLGGGVSVRSGVQTLAMRRPRQGIDLGNTIPTGIGPSRYMLMSLLFNVVECEIPLSLCNQHSITVEIYFPEPISRALLPVDCLAMTNVLAVWNSLEFAYPRAYAAEERIAPPRSRLVHPLLTDDLGKCWRTWAVTGVRTNPPLGRPKPHAKVGISGLVDLSELSLAIAPTVGIWDTDFAKKSNERENTCLSLIVNERLQRRLEAVGGGLRATAVATMGTLGNDVPRGSRLDLVDRVSPKVPEYVKAEMCTTSWGGSDGLTHLNPEDWSLSRQQAVQRGANRRTIDEFATFVEDRFGHWLTIYEPEDLLRSSQPLVARLTVRIQFKKTDACEAEKRMIIRAAEQLVNTYLYDSAHERVTFIEAATEVDSPYSEGRFRHATSA